MLHITFAAPTSFLPTSLLKQILGGVREVVRKIKKERAYYVQKAERVQIMT